jgi:hypothetical protein
LNHMKSEELYNNDSHIALTKFISFRYTTKIFLPVIHLKDIHQQYQ